MRIVLTGCSGFVGAALAPKLLSAGHELFSVCRPGSSVAFGEKVAWDSSRPNDLSGFPKRADGVVRGQRGHDDGAPAVVGAGRDKALLPRVLRRHLRTVSRTSEGERGSCSARVSGSKQVGVGSSGKAFL